MSAFRDIMSIVDPATTRTVTASKPAATTVGPRPAARITGRTDGISQVSQLKRRASGVIESSQNKIQRGNTQPSKVESANRSALISDAAKSDFNTPISTVPYRGTAAPASARSTSLAIRKVVLGTSVSSPPLKAATSGSGTAPVASELPVAGAAAPKKGYLALLQKAKEKDSTKSLALPGKQEPAKILSRKERLALKAEASTNTKGKKSTAETSSRPTDSKVGASKEKRKTIEVGYQGTARPAKKPVDIGYNGTARPANTSPQMNRTGASAAKAKSNPIKGRWDGYADWDDLDNAEDEEQDYESDISSDMEGGAWDVEEEESVALKAAKKEDAEALAEEQALKRAKDERKRKLLAMSKAAASKRRY